MEISPSSIVFLVAFLLGLYFLFLIRNILILLFLAFIIMVALHPAVSKLHTKLKLPRFVSVGLVYLVFIGSLLLLIGVLLPPMVQDLYHLLKTVDVPYLREYVNNFSFTVGELSALLDRVGSSVGVVFSVVTSTFFSIFSLLTMLVMSFYLMLDRPVLHHKVMWFTRDRSHVELAQLFLHRLESELGGWVRGQIVLMLLIGLVVYLGLFLLGVPYALPLALMAGLLEILPNVGPTVAAVPAVLLAYTAAGPVLGGATLAFYIVVQQIENNFIVPKIMRDNVGVNPLVAMVTILIGLQIGGVLGALLSIPIYLMIRIAYSMWYQQQS